MPNHAHQALGQDTEVRSTIVADRLIMLSNHHGLHQNQLQVNLTLQTCVGPVTVYTLPVFW